jgi:hypothetical protein
MLDLFPSSGQKVGSSYRFGPFRKISLGPGIESRWGRDFPQLSRPALSPTQPPVQWVPGLSRVKVRPGRDADLSPPSSADVKNRVELYLYYP